MFSLYCTIFKKKNNKNSNDIFIQRELSNNFFLFYFYFRIGTSNGKEKCINKFGRRKPKMRHVVH